MSLLTPTQASEIVGVPAVQLCRWAYLGQGPRNSGTKHKPMFDEDDLREWHHKKSMYPNGRQEAVDRLDAMIDSFDHCSGIDRSPQPWWKNQDG